ncbi:MAG: YbaK/EbsC family protein [Bacilli bacterium]
MNDLLEKLNIPIELQHHKEVFTIDDLLNLETRLIGLGTKNLFVKDRFNNYYMIVLIENKKVDLKKLKENLVINKLSFCTPEELKEILDLKPGAVTPLGVINDKNNQVEIILDEDIINEDLLIPYLTNTETIKISYQNLIRIFEYKKTNYLITTIPIKDN